VALARAITAPTIRPSTPRGRANCPAIMRSLPHLSLSVALPGNVHRGLPLAE
jgi:hypothetical protein